MSSRDDLLRRARVESEVRTIAARAQRKQKREQLGPHRVVEEKWLDLLFLKHGRGKARKWRQGERGLAKECLQDQDFEQVVAAMTYFVNEWCPAHDKFPSFRLFYAMRDQMYAELDGTVRSRVRRQQDVREMLDRGEYNAGQAARAPKIGWE